MHSHEHTQEIIERGYSVFEQAWSESEVDTLRQTILGRFAQEPGLPKQLWSTRDYTINRSFSMAYTGIVLYSLVQDRPEVVDLLLKPQVVAALRGVLGDGMKLEIVGAVMTDETRPFFAWHTHIGGYEDADPHNQGHNQGIWPVVATADRITTLLYLDDIDEDGGLLLVYPRKVGDPTKPPMDPAVEPWTGQAELRVRRGTMVAMEQCTWHTALPMRRPGLRLFLGCMFRAGHVQAPEWADTSLSAVPHANPLFASVLP